MPKDLASYLYQKVRKNCPDEEQDKVDKQEREVWHKNHPNDPWDPDDVASMEYPPKTEKKGKK